MSVQSMDGVEGFLQNTLRSAGQHDVNVWFMCSEELGCEWDSDKLKEHLGESEVDGYVHILLVVQREVES